MEINEIKVDTLVQYQIKLIIGNEVFYSEKIFKNEKESRRFLYNLRQNKIKDFYLKSIPILCPKTNVNLCDLITGQFQVEHPLENKSYNEIIKEHFKNEFTNYD